ncbi:hypothetical protein THIX_60855 [Thiomonas sp. X19]|uniref:Uncharacterized protein n=1 Tax=mine drainage metagenome TaxID=410659 RepID=E6PNG6_9ZZZZ|nr:hypothetical protein THIX_60855 [Thiomonas sp. X19]
MQRRITALVLAAAIDFVWDRAERWAAAFRPSFDPHLNTLDLS